MPVEEWSPSPNTPGPTVGAILLAAGRSQRFADGNKLLAEIDGDPVVRRAAAAVCAAGLTERVAVVGHDARAVRAALPEQFESRCNDEHSQGQHTTVRTGVAVARERGWDGVLFTLGDMPAVSPETIEAVCAAFVGGEEDVVVPTRDGRRGNPVLFGATQFQALAAVTGDRGGRRLIEQRDAIRVPVDDPGIHRDIDSREDLDSMRS